MIVQQRTTKYASFTLLFVCLLMIWITQYMDNQERYLGEWDIDVFPEIQSRPCVHTVHSKAATITVHSNAITIQEKLAYFSEVLSSHVATLNITHTNCTYPTIENSMDFIFESKPDYFCHIHGLQTVRTYALSRHRNLKEEHSLSTSVYDSILPHRGFYTCVVDKRFQRQMLYSKNSSINNFNMTYTQNCHTSLSTLSKPSSLFNPAYHAYHQNTPSNLFDMSKYDPPIGIKALSLNLEWNIPCAKCHEYPSFITYLSVIDSCVSFVNKQGIVFSRNKTIVPNSCYFLNKDLLPERESKMYNIAQPISKLFISSQPHTINYYHTIVESITRIVLFRDFLNKNSDVYIHVPHRYGEDLVRLLGINNPIVKEEVTARLVLLPMGGGCFIPSPISLQLMSSYFHNKTKSMFPKSLEWNTIVIILRKDRQFIKSETLIRDVQAMIDRHKLDLKIVVFDSRKMPTIPELMHMFYQARIIIGAHGAGLTNIIFSRPGSTLIEIVCPAPYGKPCYRNMAYTLGLRYYGQLAIEGYGNKCTDGMKVDTLAVYAALHYVFADIL